MTIKDMKIIESLKKVHPKDLIYSGVLTFFMIVVAVVFFLSTQFISQNINKVFTTEIGEGVQVLDLARYQLVAKKLGITVTTPSENVVPTEVTPPKETTPTPAIATLDRHAITIAVRNSTTKRGVAGALAKLLEDAGFSTPTTGNEKTPHETTTVLIKESKYDYAAPLLEVVLGTYPKAIATTTTENAPYDAMIIIGTE